MCSLPWCLIRHSRWHVLSVGLLGCLRALLTLAVLSERLQLPTSLLLGVPIPEEHHAAGSAIQQSVEQAVAESVENGMSRRGKLVTPWLLERVSQLSKGLAITSSTCHQRQTLELMRTGRSRVNQEQRQDGRRSCSCVRQAASGMGDGTGMTKSVMDRVDLASPQRSCPRCRLPLSQHTTSSLSPSSALLRPLDCLS